MKYPLSLLTVFFVIFLFSGSKNDRGQNKHLHQFSTNVSDTTLVDSFYILNQNRYVWISNYKLNKTGHSFLELIKNARYYGLEPEYYHYKELQKLSDQFEEFNDQGIRISVADSLEKKLSLEYFQMARDLNSGRITETESFSKLPRKRFDIDLPGYLKRAIEKDSLIEYLVGIQPDNIEYRKLQKALEKFVKHTALSDEKIKIVQYRTDSVRTYSDARKALKLHQYISDEKISDSLFLESLKKFQYDHGLSQDGIIGKYTAVALSKSTLDYYKDLAVSMERWRWKPSWEKNFIYVNIPVFQLKFYLNNNLQRMYRVVVGKRSRKTPEVYSKLNYVVAYPYWHVPRSISVNEILVKAKNDPEYMTRNHYEVFTKKLKQIDPKLVKWDTVNGRNFNYYIRQKGGSSNALGLVKFIFKNRYSIYLHDTPTKYHFERDIRAYSHGCVRVQNAMDLADRVLRFDESKYNKDSIDVFVKRKIEKKIELNKELSVYIHYITCDTDSLGHLILHQDIYNKDEKIKEILFNSSL